MINYINALLADISYLDYQKIDNTYVLQDKEKNTYSDRGLSISEARFVTDNFKVIDHQANTINGFSATTFEIITNDIPGYKKGDIIVAYRGTEGDKPAQVLPDLLITDVLNIGAGINNFSELFTTAVNKIISYVFPDKSISLTQADFANKYMEKTIAEHPDLKIGVAGHSLGGYLANYVTLNYSSHIERALTYNAPGTYMFDNLISWIKDYMSANHIEGSNEIVTASDKIINYFSNAGRYKVFFDQSILGLEIKDSFLNGYAVSWDNTFNGYLGLRSPVYAETQGTITDHLIKPSRQALMVYDILNIFQTKNVYSDDGYGRITQILQDYKYPFIESQYLDNDGNIYQLNMSQHLLNIAKMLGVTTNGGEGFDYGISLMQFAYANKDKFLLLDTKNLTEISRANTYNNRAAMYAILNNMPFYFSSSSSIVDSLLNEDKYNPLNYSKEFISSKIDFLKKIVSFRDLSQNSVYNQVNETTQTIYTFFERNNSSDSNKYAYIDVEKKIVYLNNMTREEYFDKSNEEERIYFLNKNDLDNKTLYIKNNNSKVFDSLGDDNIMVLGHNTDIFLTKGKDQITVYVEDASLGHVEILDDGLDDKFTLFGGNQDNNISGTKYTDEIHGMNGNDTLNGFEGNDALFGELGNDTLNGGDGNDILYGNTRDRKTGDLADTGTNILNGGYGADTIYGGEGTDIINYVDMKDGSYLGRKDNESTTGRYGDTIEGRGGDDIIYGTFYGDTYQYTLGDGNDTIIERRIGADTESNMVDRIKLYDIDSLSVSFSHKNTTNLYLSIPDGKGGQSVITFVDFMKNTYVEQFDFIVNGKSVTIDYKTILEKALDRTAELGIPLVGNDFMSIDLDHTETLRGLKDSNNTIIGGYGRDIIIGGDKDDIINESSVFSNSYTGAPSSDRSGISYGDQITGGKGNDTIYGTIYSDTFYYNKGDGKDTITDNSSSLNSIVLGKGIERSNLRVTRDNNYSLILKFTFADGSQNGQIILSGNMGYNNYQILFNDTTKMTYEQMIQEAIKYIDNDNSNTVLGTWYDDVIEGNGGDDIITGDRGNDTLRGGAGNDTLIGGMGLDVLEGGDGDDYINIYRDKTTIDNDSYYNGYIERGDIIRGGRGNDTIYGTYYGDTYYYDLGDGIDTMYELNNGDHSQYSAYRDTLIFGTGIVASEIKLSRDGYNSILEMVDGGKIIIKDFFKMNLIEYFKFADNTVWNWEYIRDNTPLVGTDDADTLIGFDNSIPDKIYGLAGDDKIYGNAGPNFLYGGDGNDTINEASKVDTGGNGASYIEGNKGDDTLYGSTWNTTFKFYIGDGKDTIIDSKVAFNNNMHIISFGEGITLDNISFARVSGSDLRIFYSSDDYITIKNYYYENNNPAYRRGPSYLQFSDGIYFDMYKNQDKVNTLVSTNGDDTFYTLFEKEIVRGQGGNDLFIYNMDNFFLEKAESEYYGEDGDDYFNLKRAAVIDGGEGNDQIYAWSANLVDGGAGDDLISLTESSWRVIGGKGNDTFNLREGQYGTNTYNLYFNVGDGRDIINNNGISRFNFYFNTASGDDFTDAKIIGSLYNNAVNIEYGKNSSILINNANLGHLSGKSTFHFTDRSLTIDDLYNNIYGTDEVDNYDIRNFINSAQIRAGGGNDYILGGYTRTIAYGETGDDTMILRGGYNYFDGGAGNDTYSWVDGYGQINDFSGMNKLTISTYGGYDANYKDMRLTRSGNDLLVQKIYDKRITGGILTIKEQFNGGGVSYINNLSNVNIDKMIELMAQYDSTSDSTEQANYSNEMSKLWYNQTS